MAKGLYYAKRVGGRWHWYFNGKAYGDGETPRRLLHAVLKHKQGLV